jgi:hypothetical protein
MAGDTGWNTNPRSFEVPTRVGTGHMSHQGAPSRDFGATMAAFCQIWSCDPLGQDMGCGRYRPANTPALEPKAVINTPCRTRLLAMAAWAAAFVRFQPLRGLASQSTGTNLVHLRHPAPAGKAFPDTVEVLAVSPATRNLRRIAAIAMVIHATDFATTGSIGLSLE